MSKKEVFRIALEALRAHKLRSFLTLLGVIIGVASVIAVVSVVQGLNDYVTAQVMEFGSTSFSVSKFSQGFSSLDDYWRESRRHNLTLEDMAAIEANCANCQLVAGVYNEFKTAKRGNKSAENVDLRGVTINAPYIGSAMELSEGRHFAAIDIDHAREEIIIGADVADRLFTEGEDPLGKEITLDGRIFTVIGIAERKGQFLGSPQDNFVRIPISVFRKMYATSTRSLNIQVQSLTPKDMQLAMEETRVILRSRMHRGYNDDDGFAMATAETFLDLWRSTTAAIFMVMIIVASISLVVGGVVIMNIMLVSVTERRKEIGIRKAVGAKQTDILRQFLAESVILSALGGGLGIGVGILIALLVSYLSPLPAVIKLWSVVMAVLVASAIGIFFGIYPARAAAKLDPVVALQAE
ncbi:MAG: ABC transporter permease [Candidatus Koribacter versatilis]|uniref:ABC transporter permease n=1 Tax=Candidatus Korobacter versatilis TaxID=658062 RepID=A0A932A903_9BACT|nr:ABC transporter permease [Candidatus Koribacter versatilis]